MKENYFKGIEVLTREAYAERKLNGTLDKYTLYITNETSAVAEMNGAAYPAEKGMQNAENIKILTKAIQTMYEELTDALVIHNVNVESHGYILRLISELSDRLNTLTEGAPEHLDQLKELLAYINSADDNFKEQISSLTTGKVNTADIVDSLLLEFSDRPLSAKQGVVLDQKIKKLDSEKQPKGSYATEEALKNKFVAVNLDLLIESNDIAKFNELSQKMQNGEILLTAYLSQINCHFLVNVLSTNNDGYVWNVMGSSNGELIALGRIGLADESTRLAISLNSGYLTEQKLPISSDVITQFITTSNGGYSTLPRNVLYGEMQELALQYFNYSLQYTDEKVSQLKFIELVTTLPETGETNKFYLVPKTESEETNVFDEYVWVNNAWEYVGSTKISGDIDLSNYVQKPTTGNSVIYYDAHLNAGFILVNEKTDGTEAPQAYRFGRYMTGGTLPCGTPTQPYYAANKEYVDNLPDYLTLTEEEKEKWTDTIGAVKKNTSTSTKLRLYAVNPDGTQTVVYASNVREGNAVVRYSADGRVDVGDPYLDYQAANKKYVDDKIGEIETALDNIIALQNSLIGGSV